MTLDTKWCPSSPCMMYFLDFHGECFRGSVQKILRNQKDFRIQEVEMLENAKWNVRSIH